MHIYIKKNCSRLHILKPNLLFNIFNKLKEFTHLFRAGATVLKGHHQNVLSVHASQS